MEWLEIVAPMSAEAWRKLATCLEEAEEGVVGRLDVEDEAARVGERDDVRRCWKRVGRMGWIVWKEFSEEKNGVGDPNKASRECKRSGKWYQNVKKPDIDIKGV